MSEIVDLGIDIDSIDRIHHVSDVHIRNYSRHGEYETVFKRLYESIENNATESSLIAVLGDIAHSKTEMSPELVEMMADFLSGLGDLRPTIVIPGNHDCNIKNTNRLDAITPVVENLDHENIYYLRDVGLYRVGDTVFSHFSIFSDPSDYISASDIPDEYRKVALYHGTVDRSVTEYGYVLENDEVTEFSFLNFDAALLGDIHKRQEISSYSVEEITVSEDELEDYLKAGWELVENN